MVRAARTRPGVRVQQYVAGHRPRHRPRLSAARGESQDLRPGSRRSWPATCNRCCTPLEVRGACRGGVMHGVTDGMTGDLTEGLANESHDVRALLRRLW